MIGMATFTKLGGCRVRVELLDRLEVGFLFRAQRRRRLRRARGQAVPLRVDHLGQALGGQLGDRDQPTAAISERLEVQQPGDVLLAEHAGAARRARWIDRAIAALPSTDRFWCQARARDHESKGKPGCVVAFGHGRLGVAPIA